jgi:CMP-N,N'-diacetyllegionaminic acid synthase
MMHEAQQLVVLGLVPARGGSKGLANKNLRMLNGIPLLAHSINYALDDPLIQKVYVSTDSIDIANTAREFNAEVPFLRPPQISGDLCRDESFVVHFIRYLKDHSIKCDYIALLRPTSPIRPVGMISEALSLAQKHDATCVRAMTEASCNPFKCWYENNPGQPVLSPISSYEHEAYNSPRQQLPRYYWQTGQLDLIDVKSFTSSNSITGDRVVGLFVDSKYAFDVDSLEDLRSAEKVFD